jgi:hypothetical protein
MKDSLIPPKKKKKTKQKKNKKQKKKRKTEQKISQTKGKHIFVSLPNIKFKTVFGTKKTFLKKQTKDNQFTIAKNLYIKAQKYISLEYLIP